MAKKRRLESLKIEKLHIDPEFQSRADGLDDDQIEQMTEYLKKKGGSVERISVVEVKGVGLILTDGFGRVQAHKNAGIATIQAVVTEGSMLDATIAAASANMDQVARRRTNADKRRAIEMLILRLEDAGEDWSDRKIADTIGVSHPMVSAVRESLSTGKITREKTDGDIEIPMESPPRIGKDGRKRSASTDSDDWRSLPLSEFLECDDFAWTCLKDFNVTTAGQLAEKIGKGESMGLTGVDIRSMKVQVDRLASGTPPEEKVKEKKKPETKQPGEERGFSLREFESHLGNIVRCIDDFATIHKDREASERKECIKLLTAFEKCFTAWRKRFPQD